MLFALAFAEWGDTQGGSIAALGTLMGLFVLVVIIEHWWIETVLRERAALSIARISVQETVVTQISPMQSTTNCTIRVEQQPGVISPDVSPDRGQGPALPEESPMTMTRERDPPERRHTQTETEAEAGNDKARTRIEEEEAMQPQHI